MTVVSFVGYRPQPRYDGLPWTQARIEESSAQAGPWTLIETKVVTPAPDPADPPAYNFTTEEAVLAEGWYRITFVDADGDQSATVPVFHTGGDTRRPTVEDVAILLRTRTVKGVATGLGADSGSGDFTTFDSTTRPTAVEVELLISHAAEEVAAALPDIVEHQFWLAIRRTVALRAASLIEQSFFRESAVASELDQMFTADLRALQAAIPRETAIAFGFSERELAELAARYGTPLAQ